MYWYMVVIQYTLFIGTIVRLQQSLVYTARGWLATILVTVITVLLLETFKQFSHQNVEIPHTTRFCPHETSTHRLISMPVYLVEFTLSFTRFYPADPSRVLDVLFIGFLFDRPL